MSGVATDFYDDSSSSMRLSHRATTAPPAEVFERGRLPAAGNLRTTEIAERTAIVEAESAKREAEISKLVSSHGMTRKQAGEIYDRERGAHGKSRRAEERADRRQREIENLADHRKKPAKHSSSKSSRRRTAKKGTWICGSCGLEYCEHRPKSKGGRPATSNRSLESHIRYSPMTAAALRASKLKPSDAAEVFAIAWRDGISVRAAATAFRSQRGAGEVPAA